MKTIVTGFCVALLLAGCGVGGAPVTPKISGTQTFGVHSHKGIVTETEVNVSVGVEL